MNEIRRYWNIVKYALPTKPLFILIASTFFVLLPLICWNLEHSAYFIQGDLNYAAYIKRLANNKRIAEARTHFNLHFNKKLLPFNYHQTPSNIVGKISYPKIAFVILAINRDLHKIDAYEPKYLTQTMHALLVAIDNDVKQFGKRWSNISISMCNADNVPERFFELKLLSRYFESMEMKPIGAKVGAACQAKAHMIACLSAAMDRHRGVDTLLVIEDDLLANRDLLAGLTELLSRLQWRFKSAVASKLAYIQLYYPKRSVAFSLADPESWLELMFISLALVAVLYGIYFRMHMRSLFMLYNALLLVVLLLICVGVVVAIGRPHWRSAYHKFVKSYALIEPLHRSTAAVLMDRQFAVQLVRSKRAGACGHNDSTANYMASVATDTNRRILSVNFNLFRHIGLYSAFKKTIINPHHVE